MITQLLKNIKWLGHSGFRIRSGQTVIVIDPYKVTDIVPADIILITHPHFDHCSIDDIRRIQKPSSVIVTESDSAEKLSGDIRIVAPGDKLSVYGIQIEAVRAYNVNKNFHHKGKNWLGFIITVDTIRIYHAGDTDLIPEMETFSADIAMLPVSGTYVMNVEAAVEAVKLIQPTVAIPMHYDLIIGSTRDAIEFKKALEGLCDVVIFST
ncbi:MAG: MBL fold metallo-hydrolase [Desulfobacterales bacterium]|nr:MBL fold metallo-hydrolase [Desulfobacterales bacterium]MDD4070959.1 MBL fold metallo-hydrolase [Desulfobacterales bacterium]MDD4393415.1 MBL fold metallo-hydrolase [Desulfobacterales bacterium]